MTGFRFDQIRSLVEQNRAARNATTEQTGHAPLAQEASPAVPDPELRRETLFVQSFHSGSLAPSETHPDRLTVTLEHGLGQTIAFSDRPARSVSANPTARFLDGIGFPPDNPPNAALLLETSPGEQEITVVELFDPVYDEGTATLSYDIAMLATWHDSTDFGFTPSTLDADHLPETFGTAHLFIDDCADGDIVCWHRGKEVGRFADHDWGLPGWMYDDVIGACIPSSVQHQYGYQNTTQIVLYYIHLCETQFPACEGECDVSGPVPYFNYQ